MRNGGTLRDFPRRAGYGFGPRVASRLRKWWVLARHPHADVRFTEPIYLGPGFSLHVPDGGAFHAGPYCDFRRNFRAEVTDGATLRIGSRCAFTYDVLLRCARAVTIGDRCLFAQGALVDDGGADGVKSDGALPAVALRVGDDAWVGAQGTVLASLGARAIVGAHALVLEPVAACCVAAGAPACVVSYFGPEGAGPGEIAGAGA